MTLIGSISDLDNRTLTTPMVGPGRGCCRSVQVGTAAARVC